MWPRVSTITSEPDCSSPPSHGEADLDDMSRAWVSKSWLPDEIIKYVSSA